MAACLHREHTQEMFKGTNAEDGLGQPKYSLSSNSENASRNIRDRISSGRLEVIEDETDAGSPSKSVKDSSLSRDEVLLLLRSVTVGNVVKVCQ